MLRSVKVLGEPSTELMFSAHVTLPIGITDVLGPSRDTVFALLLEHHLLVTPLPYWLHPLSLLAGSSNLFNLEVLKFPLSNASCLIISLPPKESHH